MRYRSRLAGTCVTAAAACLVWAAPVAAQSPRWEVGASGTRIAYDSLAPLQAPGLSGLVEWRRPELFARLDAGVTRFGGAGWSVHGSADAARRFPVPGAEGLRLELGGRLASSRHSSGSSATLGRLDARLQGATRLSGSAVGGAWVGVGSAWAAATEDAGTVRSIVPQAGVWATAGPLRGTLAYQRPSLPVGAFDEWALTLALATDRLDLWGFTGYQRAADETDARGLGGWGGVGAAFWATDRLAFEVVAGRYGADVVRGLPGGDFVSVGIRLTRARLPVVPEAALRTPLVYRAEELAARGVSFEVPDAARVEIAGDWNGWTPQELELGPSGAWHLRAPLPTGIHRFNLLVDGERWIVPEGFPTADDGFGGAVGLLIVSDEGDPR